MDLLLVHILPQTSFGASQLVISILAILVLSKVLLRPPSCCRGGQQLAQHFCTCVLRSTAGRLLSWTHGSQVVEPVWGSKEYIKYLVLVNTASGVSTFFVIYLAYAIDRNNEGNLLCVLCSLTTVCNPCMSLAVCSVHVEMCEQGRVAQLC